MQHLTVALKDLQPHPLNVRQGDVGLISQSLKEHGQYRPIVVQKSTMRILAGNHTFKAATALKWDSIEATLIECDDDQALRILLMDNRANDVASYDDHALVEMLREMMDTELKLDGTGFDPSDLDDLIRTLELENDKPDLNGDPDDVPDDVPSKTVPGDVWLLGKHRLVCGDSTNPTDVAKLMNGKQADIVWTDPPYGVAYVGKTKDALTIENDRLDHNQLTDFLRLSLGNASHHTKDGGCWYVAAPSGNLFQCFSIPLTELEIWKHTLIWVKDTLVMGRADYHYRHEAIFYGWKPGAAHQTPPDRKQDTIWEIPRPKRNDVHPTMKPIELITKALNNSSSTGDIVLDPFGGSGSTLIAAHQTNRIGYLLELDPHYCDVICTRFQQLTGIKPIAEATGNEHSFIND